MPAQPPSRGRRGVDQYAVVAVQRRRVERPARQREEVEAGPGGGDPLYAAPERYDARTRLAKSVTVWPEMMLGSAAAEMQFRFQWTSPTVFSPHDPNLLYHGGNHVFRLWNRAENYAAISPDLTRNSPDKGNAVGSGAENFGVVYSLTESPLRPGLLWAGTDDGRLWVTTDDRRVFPAVVVGSDPRADLAILKIPATGMPVAKFAKPGSVRRGSWTIAYAPTAIAVCSRRRSTPRSVAAKEPGIPQCAS